MQIDKARWIITALAIMIPVVSTAWGTDFYRLIGLNLFGEQILSLLLALVLPLAFLLYPASGRGSGERISIPLYDIFAALLGFTCALYIAFEYPRIFEELYTRPLDATLVGAVLILLVVECLRRTAGTFLAMVVLFFLVFALFGHLVPGELQGRKVALDRLIVYLAIDSNGMFGLPMVVSSTIVVAFVLFGNLLTKSGGGDFFTDISMAAMGRYRGGSAKIAVTASSLFGSISGSAVSNVASTGIITIPLMKSGGFRASTAAAIESVASTGGQLMPPVMGAAAFLMAEMLQISYTDIVVAALPPAALYYLALFIQADLLAARNGIEKIDKSKIPQTREVFSQGWLFIVPFVILILALFQFGQRPENAALFACISLLVIGLFSGYRGRRLHLSKTIDILVATGKSVVDIILIGAAAGIIIGVLNITSLGFALTLSLVDFAGGSLPMLLVLAAIVSIILGMGMPTVGVYILLATLVAPSLIELGVRPLAAHLFVLYFGMMSMITPPVAIAAYAAAVIAKSNPISTSIEAVRFAWSAYIIPFVFVFSPALILEGDLIDILLAISRAGIGIWLVTASIVGYFNNHLNFSLRIIYLLLGIGLLIPAEIMPGGFPMVIFTLSAGLFAIVYEFMIKQETAKVSGKSG
ncbi:MAG: C4-dicarboxylate ABC transporter permease [Blastopirellula sp.]|nr:MAG: C4-dicarboxylate ABC transporter permease [Blastopirellula sp.]